MTAFPGVLETRLQRLDEDSCRRSLALREGLDFSSNDYLGFSQDPDLKAKAMSRLSEFPIGSSASRLLRGHQMVFQETEKEFATFCGRDSCTLFPSGYQANVGLLSAILKPGDLVFSDQSNHASIIDGIRLSGARRVIYPHGNWVALRTLLKEQGQSVGLKVIVTESLFGMDGDIAPLLELSDLSEEFSACLVVDEAHATGLWGDFESNQGGGIVQSLGLSDRVFATVHPVGKALGVGGGAVCGDEKLKEYLVNFSRSFIFSTAPIPAMAVFLKEAILHWKEVGKTRAQKVFENANELRRKLKTDLKEGESIPDVKGPITPVIIGDNARTLLRAASLREKGFDIRAIRPPTVPEGQARLRITSQSGHTSSEIQRLVNVFAKGENT
jgi:8-amino-7-oxononanoate synthase